MLYTSTPMQYRPKPHDGGPNKTPHNHSMVFNGLLHSPNQQSPAHILAVLNDDCIYEVFKSFHLLDLCAVANVCTRFHDVATQIIRARYAKRMFDLRQLRHNGHITLDQMDDCLRLFGSVIRSIEVTFELHEDVILGMIAAHCTNLEELEFNGSNISTATITALRPVISQVKSLNLRCLDDRIKQLFSSTSQLRSLYVRDSFGLSTLPNVKLPKLTELTLIGLKLQQTSFKNLIAHNRHITKLEISDGPIDDNLLHCIPQYLQKLEHLILNYDCPMDNSISKWDDLKCLRTLELNGKDFPISAIMQALVDGEIPLKRLKLTYSGADENDFMDYLCRMQSITDLEFTANSTNLNDSQLIQIAQALNNLQQIRVNSMHVTINGIRQMLQYANRLKESIFRIYAGQHQVYCEKMLNELDCDAIATVIEDRVKMMISMCGTASQRADVRIPLSFFFNKNRILMKFTAFFAVLRLFLYK